MTTPYDAISAPNQACQTRYCYRCTWLRGQFWIRCRPARDATMFCESVEGAGRCTSYSFAASVAQPPTSYSDLYDLPFDRKDRT